MLWNFLAASTISVFTQEKKIVVGPPDQVEAFLQSKGPIKIFCRKVLKLSKDLPRHCSLQKQTPCSTSGRSSPRPLGDGTSLTTWLRDLSNPCRLCLPKEVETT